jgi:alcohol dehydrogenase class IV
MEDLPGNYIDIDRFTYVTSPYARVIDGKLAIVTPTKTATKLVPSTVGTACDIRDVCVVTTNENHIKWSLKDSETD